MWIKRDFLLDKVSSSALPIKVLTGPRQVGKTSVLRQLKDYKIVYLDDAAVRRQAQDNPRFFLDQLPAKLILDEAPLAPALFSELKSRVDAARAAGKPPDDVWITGSNQTLMQRNVRESLSGRASYFQFNTLSIHELGALWSLPSFLIRGGWPELYVSPQLDPVRYLNDLISTFIERDIVATAGIERREAFIRVLALVAGRIGQLFNASDIAKNVGVDTTTVQSWLSILDTNGIVRKVESYHTNLNQRLIKAPKYYFEDIGMAVRLQGWADHLPLIGSPLFGNIFENIVLGEVVRFFVNRGERPKVWFVRSKEKVEVDFLVELDNQRFVAIEVKVTPEDLSQQQIRLLETLKLNIVDHWVVSATPAPDFPTARVVEVRNVWERLQGVLASRLLVSSKEASPAFRL